MEKGGCLSCRWYNPHSRAGIICGCPPMHNCWCIWEPKDKNKREDYYKQITWSCYG